MVHVTNQSIECQPYSEVAGENATAAVFDLRGNNLITHHLSARKLLDWSHGPYRLPPTGALDHAPCQGCHRWVSLDCGYVDHAGCLRLDEFWQKITWWNKGKRCQPYLLQNN
jgi:hypothetical protein